MMRICSAGLNAKTLLAFLIYTSAARRRQPHWCHELMRSHHKTTAGCPHLKTDASTPHPTPF